MNMDGTGGCALAPMKVSTTIAPNRARRSGDKNVRNLRRQHQQQSLTAHFMQKVLKQLQQWELKLQFMQQKLMIIMTFWRRCCLQLFLIMLNMSNCISQQLLLLGGMLEYFDATNWRVANTFVHDLLYRNLDYEVDDTSNKIVIGDGINLGGHRDWACTVSTLAKKVRSVAGEFEEILLGVIEELAKPCGERTAYFMQWMHCLAVTVLLLENTKSFHHLQGKAIEP